MSTSVGIKTGWSVFMKKKVIGIIFLLTIIISVFGSEVHVDKAHAEANLVDGTFTIHYNGATLEESAGTIPADPITKVVVDTNTDKKLTNDDWKFLKDKFVMKDKTDVHNISQLDLSGIETIGNNSESVATEGTIPRSALGETYAFGVKASNLDVFLLPKNTQYIGYDAFRNLPSLGKSNGIILPETLTSIGADAFNGTSIKNLTLPESMTSFHNSALSGLPHIIVPVNLFMDSNITFYSYYTKSITIINSTKPLTRTSINITNNIDAKCEFFEKIELKDVHGIDTFKINNKNTFNKIDITGSDIKTLDVSGNGFDNINNIIGKENLTSLNISKNHFNFNIGDNKTWYDSKPDYVDASSQRPELDFNPEFLKEQTIAQGSAYNLDTANALLFEDGSLANTYSPWMDALYNPILSRVTCTWKDPDKVAETTVDTSKVGKHEGSCSIDMIDRKIERRTKIVNVSASAKLSLTSIDLTLTPDSSNQNSVDVTMSAVLSGDGTHPVTGSVTFMNGSDVLAGDVAIQNDTASTKVTLNKSDAPFSITAVYNGNDDYESKTSTAKTFTFKENTPPDNTKKISITGLSAENKSYDGTTSASISNTPHMAGVDAGDENLVTITGTAKGSFSDASAGSNKIVTISGLTLVLDETIKDKYILDTITLSADIEKAELSVQVENKTKKQGEDNPPLTHKIIGFIEGENEENAHGYIAPALTTTAEKTSPSGDYVIKAEGGFADNYTFVYIPGVLTVNDDSNTNTTEDTYEIKGIKGENGWYISTVTIHPKGEYTQISNGETWSDMLQIKDGTYDKLTFKLKTTDKKESKEYTVENIKIDTSAPEISGIKDHGTYYTNRAVIVNELNFASMKINGEVIEKGKTITLEGDKDTKYAIEVIDEAGNKISYDIVMKPIASLTSKLASLTKDSVTQADKNTIDEVLSMLNKELNDKDNVISEEQKNKLKQSLETCEELLKAIQEKTEIKDQQTTVNNNGIANVKTGDTTSTSLYIALVLLTISLMLIMRKKINETN